MATLRVYKNSLCLDQKHHIEQYQLYLIFVNRTGF